MYLIKTHYTDIKLFTNYLFDRIIDNLRLPLTYINLSTYLNIKESTIRNCCNRLYKLNKDNLPVYVTNGSSLISFIYFSKSFNNVDNYLLSEGIKIQSNKYMYLRYILMNSDKFTGKLYSELIKAMSIEFNVDSNTLYKCIDRNEVCKFVLLKAS